MTQAIDLRTTPFSRFGSYIALSDLPADEPLPAGLYLRSLRGPLTGPSPWQPLMRLDLLVDGALVDGSPADGALVDGALVDGALVAASSAATATLLRLAHDDHVVELCFESADRLRVQGRQAGLRLTLQPSGYDFALPHAANRLQVVFCSSVETKFMLYSLAGTLDAQVAWTGVRTTSLTVDLLPGADGCGEWCIDEYLASWSGGGCAATFAAAQQGVQEEYERWAANCLRLAAGYPAAAAQAAYVTWSCVVAAAGHLRRRAMYMSKNAMASIWSWDNCFNALALALHDPHLAWDQLMVMIDLQDASGVLPDLANDRFVSWSFCKPPIYGWALLRLAKRRDFLTPARLAEIYAPLCRLTEWWFRQRDDNGDGIPQYNHGNESGWDNSTVFQDLPPIDSPDLAAYLVLQMEFLAQAAAQLGYEEERHQWQARAERLLRQMIDYFWREDRFVARHSASGAVIDCDSLLLFMPLLLGKRLPPSVIEHLTARLRRPGRFLTEFGPASESIASPFYRPDGYWRGPLWGAPTVMLVEGLTAAGKRELAADVRRRFCNLVAAHGLAENYNAISGEPLRDRAFTWTASAFLLLAAEDIEESDMDFVAPTEPEA